ncbi:MAG: DUF3445 domain-containing protein [Pseudomonadota bacterium]
MNGAAGCLAPERATALIAPPPRLPFMHAQLARRPGVLPLHPSAWTVVERDFAAQAALRDALVARQPNTVLALAAEAEDAADALLEAVLDHLADREDYAVEPERRRVLRPDGAVVAVERAAPMRTLARLTAEDWCLMQRAPGAEEYALTAAALCFPSRWLLAEKLGRAMISIHEPVEDYDDMLARRVARLFDGLRPGRPLVRVNWLVHDDPALFQPLSESRHAGAGQSTGQSTGQRAGRSTGHSTGPSTGPSTGHSAGHSTGHSTGHSAGHSTGPSTGQSAGHSTGPSAGPSAGPGGPGARGFYLRTERQTLARLARTGAVAFGIKTSVTPIAALAPHEAAALAEALSAMHDGAAAHRIGEGHHAAALAALARIADPGGPRGPVAPGGPRGPAGPVAPVATVAPVAPGGPGGGDPLRRVAPTPSRDAGLRGD